MPFYRCVPPSSGGGGGGGDLGEVTENVTIYDEQDNPYILYRQQDGYWASQFLNSSAQQASGYPDDIRRLLNNSCENASKIIYDGKVGIFTTDTSADGLLQNFQGKMIFGEYIGQLSSTFNKYAKANFPVEIQYNGYLSPRNFNYFIGQYTFGNSTSYNSEVFFKYGNNGNFVLSLYGMFINTSGYNRQFNVPAHAQNIGSLFYNSKSFNSHLKILRDRNWRIPYSAMGLLSADIVYSKPTAVPIGCYYNESGRLHAMFSNTYAMSEPIAICCTNCEDLNNSCNINIETTFNNSINISDVIFFGNNMSSNNIIGAHMAFYKTNYYKRLNIYVNDIQLTSPLMTSKLMSDQNTTWTATTNGYYNSAYNVYVLNNWQDGLNMFNARYYEVFGEYPEFYD